MLKKACQLINVPTQQILECNFNNITKIVDILEYIFIFIAVNPLIARIFYAIYDDVVLISPRLRDVSSLMVHETLTTTPQMSTHPTAETTVR